MGTGKKAFLFAAGFGSRMVPVTCDIPKPLVPVNGVRIIDTIIDAMVLNGISDITVIRGYKKECFDVLLEKYPFLKFRDNDEYSSTNNISSAMTVVDELEECYILDSDLIVSNPDLMCINPGESSIIARYVDETDDWCVDMKDGCAANYRKGGKNCWQTAILTYWNREDSEKLRQFLKEEYAKEGGRDIFWEFIPLVLHADDFNVKIRACREGDIVEIDNFSELVALDPGYKDYKAGGNS